MATSPLSTDFWRQSVAAARALLTDPGISATGSRVCPSSVTYSASRHRLCPQRPCPRCRPPRTPSLSPSVARRPHRCRCAGDRDRSTSSTRPGPPPARPNRRPGQWPTSGCPATQTQPLCSQRRPRYAAAQDPP
ncbi:hypothetical protein N136_03858 [Leifsonia aquatica ATCC 14665]|uniref:Uncharacterized protein n=1 Tax=Leifsonia aquatica ATCC 14665 TaxID=1358026 RepID=U2RLN9_LEIAQ|nr:hypothetical protein N136_03858 [Leifsonia aquatica ATCC 14665]